VFTLASRYNYLPLLWPIHSSHRSALLRLLDLLTMESSTKDTRLLEALDVVRQHQRSRPAIPAAKCSVAKTAAWACPEKSAS
jgi:hypothetical protein